MDFISEHNWELLEEVFQASLRSLDGEAKAYLECRWEELTWVAEGLPHEKANRLMKKLRQVLSSNPSQDELAWMFDWAIVASKYPWEDL